MINGVIDFYDDPDASVLRSKVPSIEAIPDFIKTAERLTPEEADKLPDDVFALVAIERGEKLRKYACVDKGNVALNVIYFLENRDHLPYEVQKVAAANLVTACQWYDMAPPEELEKIALGLGTIANVGMAGMGVAGAGGTAARRAAALKAGMPGSQVMKISDLYGSHQMPVSKPVPGHEKVASLRPHIETTGLMPPQQVVKEAGHRHCLIKEGSAKYPIDSASQVQSADHYFQEYMGHFSPFERHQYCVKLAARADELGMRVSEVVQKYGSTKTAADVKVAVIRRQQMFREGTSEHGLLDELKEKCASINPEVLAVALENFDRSTGLDMVWGKDIDDPYYSVFGIRKMAEWSFIHGNDRIDSTRLKRCAEECREQLEELFGDEFVEEFKKDPQQIFDSLPLDSKRIIMRVGSQVEE